MRAVIALVLVAKRAPNPTLFCSLPLQRPQAPDLCRKATSPVLVWQNQQRAGVVVDLHKRSQAEAGGRVGRGADDRNRRRARRQRYPKTGASGLAEICSTTVTTGDSALAR